jgi:hypothetical protein
MKFSKFTTLLLVVNLGLVAAVGYLIARLVDLSRQPPKVIVQKSPPKVVKESRTVTVVKTNDFQWRQIESEDYRTYITRLRSIGCPEETIRDLIIADVEKLLAPQMQAAAPKRKELKYWQPEEKELWNPLEDLDADRQKQDIDFQKRDILRSLVGVDIVAERLKLTGQDDVMGKRLGFLPDEKRDQVRKLIDRYSREEVSLREKIWEDGDAPEDQAKLRQLQQQQQTAVAALLSPEEFRQYELWISPTAYQVRDSFFGMNPKETEFLAIFDLKKKFDEQWHPDELTDEAGKAKLAAAQIELEGRIRAQLGEQRFVEYQRAQDQDYRQLSIAVSRSQLPATKAVEVYEMKRIVLEQRAQVLADNALSIEDKQAALQAITTEAHSTVKETLGVKAYNFFLRRSSADWLR